MGTFESPGGGLVLLLSRRFFDAKATPKDGRLVSTVSASHARRLLRSV